MAAAPSLRQLSATGDGSGGDAASGRVATVRDWWADRRSSRRSTPGRLRRSAGLLVVLCVVYGVSSAAVSNRQHNQVEVAGDTSAVAFFEGQLLRGALSEADATASAMVLTGSDPSAELRERYDRALTEASTGLASIAGAETEGATSTGSTEITARLAASLPYYARLVDLAVANHRSGFPVAQAYLAQANNLMRQQLLADVDELVELQTGRLDDRLTAGASLWRVAGPLLALVAALLVAVGLQAWMSGKFRRRVNPPLALATLLLVIALVAQVGGLLVLRSGLDASRSEGSEPLSRLTEVRIVALQVLSDDTLRVVTSDTVPAYSENSNANLAELRELLRGRENGDLLGSIPDDPSSGDQGGMWNELLDDRRSVSAVHREITQTITYERERSVIVATGDEPGHIASVRQAFDADLDRGTEWAFGRLGDHIDRMAGVLFALQFAAPLLAVLAAVFVVVGVRPRLSEYQ